VSVVRYLYTRLLRLRGVGGVIWRIRMLPPSRRVAGIYGRRLLARAVSWDELDSALWLISNDGVTTLVIEPWTGAVDLEILYWRPFVLWLVKTHGPAFAPPRLLVESTSERASWYTDHGEPRSPDGGGRPRRSAVVQPALLARLCSSFWEADGPIRPIVRHAHYTALPASDGGPIVLSLTARDAVPPGAGTVVVPPDSTPRDAEDVVASASGVIAEWGLVPLLGILHGRPTVLVDVSTKPLAHPHVDVAMRFARAVDASLSIVAPAAVPTVMATSRRR
jgi:hypothetical protein